MSTGIPVVSTECIPQCLRIEGGCTIVPIDDADAFAKAMLMTLQNTPANARQLSEKVYQMASPQVVGMQLETILKKIVASSQQTTV
jgi:glycosyltransferase involved in cell wall biosynthesis